MYKGNITKEAIESAKLNRKHEVIETLSSMRETHWTNLANELSANVDNQIQQRLCKDSVVPVYRKLEGSRFTLQPLEIVSIWSYVSGSPFPASHYLKYKLSAALSWNYVLRNVESGEWRDLFCTGSITKMEQLSQRDSHSSNIVLKKAAEISQSLDELSYYHNGTRESAIELTVKACRGDKSAEVCLQEVDIWRKEHEDSLLSMISENWIHGLMYVTMNLKR